MIKKTKTDIEKIIEGLVIWLSAAILISWFWDRWFLVGPHGTYRWVGMDFVPFWVGVQEMLRGFNPYTPEVTLKIQDVIYGGPAGTYDPMMFVYPAWIFILFVPFSLLPLKCAVTIYSSTLILMVTKIVSKLADSWPGKKGKARYVWVVLTFISSLPFLVISALKGQLGYIGLIALYSCQILWNKKPFWAGIALGFSVIKPTVTVIPTIVILLWALYQKKWPVLSGFAVLIAFLSISSFVASGFWVPEYLDMLSITGGMPVLWSQQILVFPWNLLYAGYFIFLMFLGFRKSVRTGREQPLFSAAILAGIALFPMRWIYDLFLGILVSDTSVRFSRFTTAAVALAMFFPWVLPFFHENIRWNIAVIGMPVAWSCVFLMQNSERDIAGQTFGIKQMENIDENKI